MEIVKIIAKRLYLKHELPWQGYPGIEGKTKLWDSSTDNSIVRHKWIEIAKTVVEMRKKKIF